MGLEKQGRELIYFNLKYLDSAEATPKNIATTAMHEIAHNKGWDHFAIEGQQSPNKNLDYCNLQQIGSTHRIKERSALPRETRLAPVGRDSPRVAPGPLFSEQICDRDRPIAVGFHGIKNGLVGSVGMICKPKSVDTNDQMRPAFGSATGLNYSLRCNTGEVLVGAYGRSEYWLNTLSPICQPESIVAVGGVTGVRRSPLVAGTPLIPADFEWERQCPAGMAVRGVRIRANAQVSTLEISCKRYADVEDSVVFFHGNGSSGGPGPQASDSAIETTPGRTILTSLGSYVNERVVGRILGGFEYVYKDKTTGAVRTTGSAYMPGHGGTPSIYEPFGTFFLRYRYDACPTGQAVVGLKVDATGSDINGVTAVCAPYLDWFSSANVPVATTELPRHGFAGATTKVYTCPRSAFIVGWHVVSHKTIHGLWPMCRQTLGPEQM